MANLDQEIRARVDAFVAEISELIRRAALETVKQALGGAGEARVTPRIAAPRRKAAAKDGARRSANELDRTKARLLAQITSKPGQRIDQIAKELGVSTKELALPARKLIAEKVIATKGQKRATSYWPR